MTDPLNIEDIEAQWATFAPGALRETPDPEQGTRVIGEAPQHVWAMLREIRRLRTVVSEPARLEYATLSADYSNDRARLGDKTLEAIERRASAQQAAHPGPYQTGEGYEQERPGYYVSDARGLIVAAEQGDAPLDLETRDYLAALAPSTVLALVAAVRRLRAENAELAAQIVRTDADEWTIETPIEAGHYWLRSPMVTREAGEVVCVYLSEDSRLVVSLGAWGPVAVEDVKYAEWAGPIQEPTK